MPSVITTSKKSLFSTFLVTQHTASQDEPKEEKSPAEEKPAEQKSTWKPGGYTPTRASWHTIQGRIKSYLS